MGELKFWKILRVLTSNTCNYNCTFCHNEGQEKNHVNKQLLKFKDFRTILDSLSDSDLQELHFSGGEPFVNTDTLKMILYANDNTTLEIGCATNTTFLNEEMIKQLSKTRIKLNIQFPSMNLDEFKEITKNGDLNKVIRKLDLLKKNNISFGLNHVITSKNQSRVKSIVDFSREQEVPLKLLPDINDINFVQLKKNIYPLLDSLATSKIDKCTGAIKWGLEPFKTKGIQVMYIDSPCFYTGFEQCKNFAEIRLLPNLTLQTCIKKSKFNEFDFEIEIENKASIKNKFQELWTNFTNC